MPGEFHRSSVHCVKERLDLEVVPISLCSALTFLGSRRLSNVCWNQPVRVTLSPLRPATNRAGQSPGKVKKAHDPVSGMATRSRVMCEFRLKKELGMERSVYSRRSRYGQNLRAFVVYLMIELRLSNQKAVGHLSLLFDLWLDRHEAYRIKSAMAEKYMPTYRGILRQISNTTAMTALRMSASWPRRSRKSCRAQSRAAAMDTCASTTTRSASSS